MTVEFFGGPLDGQFRQIHEGRAFVIALAPPPPRILPEPIPDRAPLIRRGLYELACHPGSQAPGPDKNGLYRFEWQGEQ